MGETTRYGVHLRRSEENSTEIDTLAGRLGGRVGLEGVLGDLDRRARRWPAPGLLGRAVDHAVRWDAADSGDARWMPQGVSSTADASQTEEVLGRRLLVTTWYAPKAAGRDWGSRVTFLDLATLRYRHVLLVEPTESGLRPLRVHAGGLVWAGPYLHVAATGRGFVSARVEDVMAIDPASEHGAGHSYVLPVRHRYVASADDGVEGLRYSFLSLDRRPDDEGLPGLVAGEYGRGQQTTRLTRFAFDPGTWQLSTDDDGLSRPLRVDEGGPARMQGAVVARGDWYVTVSQGRRTPGSVYAGRPGDLRHHRFATPIGPEDVCYWPSTDTLWSLSEHPGMRFVFGMRRSWFD